MITLVAWIDAVAVSLKDALPVVSIFAEVVEVTKTVPFEELVWVC